MSNKLKEKQIKNLIARRLREVRTQKGLTGYQLAKAIHSTQGLISQYETAVSVPPLNTLIAICDVLRCSVDHLLGRDAEYGVNTYKDIILNLIDNMSFDHTIILEKIAIILAESDE